MTQGQPATPLTQEQVLAALQVRVFEEGYPGTPLRDFWGTLKSITGEMRNGQSGPYMVALYNSEEVEVIQSNEPYTSPIAQIDVSVSTKAKSKMGYLGASIDKIINAGLAPDVAQSEAKNMDSLIGKKLHWQFTPGHMIPNRDESNNWSDKPTNCWVITEISGEAVVATPAVAPVAGQVVTATPAPAVTVVSASQQALTLLDGKNVQQWHQVVMADPIVKQDTKVLQSIIDTSFLSGMETGGKMTKNTDGVYHVVA